MSPANRLSPDDIDPASLGRAVLRALPRTLVFTATAFVATFGGLSLVAPRYQSEAELTIDAKAGSNPFSDPKQSQAAADSTTSRMDKEAINTHIRSLQSPGLAARIVADLKLKDSVEFNSALGDIDPLARLLRQIGIGGPRSGQTEQDRVLEAYFARLDVYAARESRFIGIRFTSADPELAAKIPNAIADAYRQELADRQVEETKDVQDALSPKIEQLTKDVSEAEVAVERFRGKTDSFNTGMTQRQTLNEQQLGELTNELSRSQAARSEAEARSKSAQEMMKGGSGEVLPDVQRSPLIQNLVQQRVRAERQIAEVSATLLPGHPRMRQLNADLAGLKAQINAEVAKIVDGLGKEAKVAAEREAAVKKRLSDLKATVVSAGPDEAELKMLAADARSKREELERLQAQYNMNKTRADSKAVPVEAKLIAAATPASVPVFPKKLPWAALAALATFILGLALAILKATAVGARSGSRDVRGRAATKADFQPSATESPLASVSVHKSDQPAALAVESMPSPRALADHFVARTLPRGGYRSLVAGVTDAVETSAVAVAFASGIVAGGEPTVLIEWSYGAGSIARRIGVDASPGMAELIAGSVTFEDVITLVPGTECHFIPAGRLLNEVEAARDPDQVNLILDALDEAYAHIVVAGGHAAIRDLFETIEGRFDAGVIVEDSQRQSLSRYEPNGTFLGFEVADIELVSIAAPAPVRPVAASRPRETLTGRVPQLAE